MPSFRLNPLFLCKNGMESRGHWPVYSRLASGWRQAGVRLVSAHVALGLTSVSVERKHGAGFWAEFSVPPPLSPATELDSFRPDPVPVPQELVPAKDRYMSEYSGPGNGSQYSGPAKVVIVVLIHTQRGKISFFLSQRLGRAVEAIKIVEERIFLE